VRAAKFGHRIDDHNKFLTAIVPARCPAAPESSVWCPGRWQIVRTNFICKRLMVGSFFRAGGQHMKYRPFLLTLTILCLVPLANAQNKAGIANPAIDMEGYLRVSAEAAKHREARRLSERRLYPDEQRARNRHPGRAEQAEI
jgi:hypothetical protein